LIEPRHPKISIVRQCQLLGLPRGSYYYAPEGETEFNFELMREID
jgi:putative transposase